ncbi:MAG TPA: glucosamine-6-phosphate deaminase [Anaerolineae bacterium]|nr:glucosamine-6-phosphate deaminase [Anaerolineae bacterium]HOR00687.1 glucosamine-6-phosphate deaminase [Anaerolineae bacterium]HPL29977.1 glucosamine-6-phosphate deaminase [Anaerolineae bacterium]
MTTEPLRTLQVDALKVEVYATREEMGRAAASRVAQAVGAVQASRGYANVVLAAAPSQNELLASLATLPVDWARVRAFHMDEYVGLPAQAPQAFGQFLRQRLFDRVQLAHVHYLDGNAPDMNAECRRYAALLTAYPADVVCAGIGENGHLAFNDPPVADFADPALVKVVALDLASRRQQVNDGCFATLAQVPTHAVTLTIPALMRGAAIHCVVPGPSKAVAVRAALTGGIDTACPASVLRRHPGAVLYLDVASAAQV